jgi:alpha-acetolactate decarboxylase
VVIGESNRQRYVIRNEIVELSKDKMNPYILCYRRRPNETARQKATMISDDIKSSREKKYQLPDFWYLQLQNGIERPFRNQLVCKHNALKPNVESKMLNPVYVSADVYEDLFHFYKDYKANPASPTLTKRSSLSPRVLAE